MKRSLHFTDIGLPESGEVRSGGALVATTQDVVDDLQACHEIGIDQLTYDFRVTEIDDCVRVMELGNPSGGRDRAAGGPAVGVGVRWG